MSHFHRGTAHWAATTSRGDWDTNTRSGGKGCVPVHFFVFRMCHTTHPVCTAAVPSTTHGKNTALCTRGSVAYCGGGYTARGEPSAAVASVHTHKDTHVPTVAEPTMWRLEGNLGADNGTKLVGLVHCTRRVSVEK